MTTTTIIKSPVLQLSMVALDTFKDFRGTYTETYNAAWFDEFYPTFTHDDVIHSTRAVLRGYHGDWSTWKYVTCLYGRFVLHVVCFDPGSSHFLMTEPFLMDAARPHAVLLPPKYLNAHQCVSESCLFNYKQTGEYRGEQYAYTVKYNEFGFEWPHPPILSDRDLLRARPWKNYMHEGLLLRPEQVNV